MTYKTPKFPLTIRGFIFLGKLDKIVESNDILLKNFEIFIRCPGSHICHISLLMIILLHEPSHHFFQRYCRKPKVIKKEVSS